MGKPIEGSLKRVLADLEKTKTAPKTDTNISLTTNLSNPEDYILLPGKTHEDYSYNDLLVSMYRLGMTTEVEEVANQLGYKLSNSAKENNGRDYIGNINWGQALKLNLHLGGSTLNPRQSADFLLLLKSGNAIDGTGNKISSSKLDEILDEIMSVRDPYRAEWFDADFKYIDEKLWLYSEHTLDSNKNLTPNYKKKLESCLITKGDKINLSTMNSQGMPTENGNDFFYWCPDKDNNFVAWFYADSDGSGLGCCGGPSSSVASLGVRRIMRAGSERKN